MYAIYYQTQLSKENIFDLNEEMLKKVIDSYNEGNIEFTLKGKAYSFSNLFEIKIFKIEDETTYKKVIKNPRAYNKYLIYNYISPDLLEKIGLEITYELIGNNEFGNIRKEKSVLLKNEIEWDTKELVERKELLSLLVDKKTFLEKELITTYDSEKKFALQEKIKELENRILELKK